MLFLTTTAIDIDEELLNRCLVLTVDESREHTRAIHALQRRRQTLEGLPVEEDRAGVTALHWNAQAQLEKMYVVNPFADGSDVLGRQDAHAPRPHEYLTLIRAVALLHQHRRRVHAIEHRGRQLRYIEVTTDDIQLANALAHEVLGSTLMCNPGNL